MFKLRNILDELASCIELGEAENYLSRPPSRDYFDEEESESSNLGSSAIYQINNGYSQPRYMI